MAAEQAYRQLDVSGGLQTATSRLLRKRNEVALSENVEYNRKIGSAVRRLGYEQVGRVVETDKDGLGLHVYRYSSNNKLLAATNTSDDSATQIKYLDINGYWQTITTSISPNTRLQFLDTIGDLLVTGKSSNDTYSPVTQFGSDLTNLTTIFRTNYVTNPSFEVDTTSWGVYLSTETVSRVTTNPYSGTSCVKVINGAVGSFGFFGGYTYNYSGTILPNTTYTMSAWLRTDSGTVSARMYDGNNTNGDTVTIGPTWTRISVTTTNIGGGTSFVAQVDTSGATWYIDGAQIELGTTVTNFFDGSYSGARWTGTANASTSERVAQNYHTLYAPKAAYIAEYAGRLYALNCQIGNTKYKDRIYQSSPAMGAITFVQGDQQGLLKNLRVDSVKYLKPGMVLDIYRGGTDGLLATFLMIVSVDKVNNLITFTDTQMTLKDNDELWLTGRKGKLTYFWNTDYPNAEGADWFRVPPGLDPDPEIKGWGINNNRLFIYTRNTMLKWDGANLITVSPDIGTVSHETVKNIGSWTLWLHNTGIWAYNDATGQLKLLSRAISNYMAAINQSNLPKASANVNGRVYKVSVGELLPVDAPTTSTSTSSTSTSSTSSSTSSTSTSSTSTSSTSSSTSMTYTTTSTSSTSTSSTSSSTSTTSTSTSLSTSSTSTSTTTVSGGRKVVRFVYDFDSNAFWPEIHTREIRFQIMHRMNGYTKPYFIDDTGRVLRDETGNLDLTDTIPMRYQYGRTNFGSEAMKAYIGVYAESESARGAELKYSVNGGDFKSIGQLTDTIKKIDFPGGVHGRDINYEITHNGPGEPPSIDGLVTYFSFEETTYASN